MTTIVTTNIAVSKRGDAYEVKIVPPVTRVPNNDTTETTAKLVWTCSGATFTAADAFRWKGRGNGQPEVRLDGDKLVSAEYKKITDVRKSVSWEYEFTIQVAGGPTLVIDPEVENLPPGLP